MMLQLQVMSGPMSTHNLLIQPRYTILSLKEGRALEEN